MKIVRRLLILSIAMVPMATSAWSPVDGAMLTQWGENVTPDNVWTEYPRPQLVRNNWINLNGLWNVAVTNNRASQPAKWEEEFFGEALYPSLDDQRRQGTIARK